MKIAHRSSWLRCGLFSEELDVRLWRPGAGMGFDFDECRVLILRGVIAALRSRGAEVEAIERAGGGHHPTVTGVALDLAPWHGGVGLALRLSSDPRDDPRRYRSVEWKHFNFVSQENCEALVPVGAYIGKAYRSKGKRGCLDMAHLVFLAGAEALLDKKVTALLRAFGVEAPVVRDRPLGGRQFDYVVVDPDGTIRGNYCELVVAMRVTQRLLGAPA
jgi:hypothetical protein